MLTFGLAALITQLLPGAFLTGGVWLWFGDLLENRYTYLQFYLPDWLPPVIASVVLGCLLSAILDFFEAWVLPRFKWWRAEITREPYRNVWDSYTAYAGLRSRWISHNVLAYRSECRNGIALLVLAIAWLTTSDDPIIPYSILSISLVCIVAAIRTQRLLGNLHP